MINKIAESVAQALAGVKDGATVLIGGFGTAGIPGELIDGLIAQGARDPRVNKDESDQVVDALKARGVEVQYMVKDNEGHGFHNDENKFEFYEAMEKFLVEHLKP